jgi:predicted PurR-regulated permease PerM
VNAHPLEIFIVIIIAGNIAGITGMIFAVPGYTFLRIIARQFFTNFKLVRSLTKNM